MAYRMWVDPILENTGWYAHVKPIIKKTRHNDKATGIHVTGWSAKRTPVYAKLTRSARQPTSTKPNLPQVFISPSPNNKYSVCIRLTTSFAWTEGAFSPRARNAQARTLRKGKWWTRQCLSTVVPRLNVVPPPRARRKKRISQTSREGLRERETLRLVCDFYPPFGDA